MVLVLFACSCRVIFLEGIDWVRYRLEGQKGPCFWGTLCASRHHSRGSTKLSTSSACADWDGKEEVGKGHWAPWVHKEHGLFPLGIAGVASSKSLPARKCCIGKVAYESDFCSSPLIPLSLKLSFWNFVEKKTWCFFKFFLFCAEVLSSLSGNVYRTCKQPYLKISVDLGFHYKMSQDWARKNKSNSKSVNNVSNV